MIKFERRKRVKDPYRHIEVKESQRNGMRIVTVRCPTNYPGLTERERRRMYDGLAMIANAFMDADARMEAKYNK